MKRGIFYTGCRTAAGLAALGLCLATVACTTANGPTDDDASASTTPGRSNTITKPTTDLHTGAPAHTETTSHTDHIQTAIDTRLASASLTGQADAALVEFYRQRNNEPAWYDDGQLGDLGRTLVATIETIDRQGLVATDYLADDVRNEMGAGAAGPLSPSDIAARDVALSRGFLRLAKDLHHGIVADPKVRASFPAKTPGPDYTGALEQAADDDPARVLAGLGPQQPGYPKLVDALARYRAIQGNGGWPTIPDGPVLRQGMQDTRIATLWRRLQITGDAPADQPAPSRYDDTIMAAMRHYQRRNGLGVDGLLGVNTLAALNVSARARVGAIVRNLERWRWMPSQFGPRYIAVNVPAFTLIAVDNDQQQLSMNVIVGGSYDDRATPIFGDTMRYLVFRPYWNVPHGIAADEIVPKQRANSGYLASKHYQIVKVFGPNAEVLPATPANIDAVARGELNIRQEGGPNNALGLVKFIFPNHHAVYLHSTPADSLFDRTQRDLSHGCVRVSDPEALAAFVLSEQPAWTRARIDDAMHNGDWQHVDLAEGIPVYLMYQTAFVVDDTVNFRADLYDRDPALRAAMNTRFAERI